MRRQPRPLRDHRRVDVPYLEPRLADKGRRSLEQINAARVLPLRIIRRKVLPDIAEPGSPQQRIDDRVRQYVRVAVPGESDLACDLDAAKDEGTALLEAVDVVADAYAHSLCDVAHERVQPVERISGE